MLAEASLKSGDLDAALSQLQDEIRNDPADAKKRVFIFQLLAVLGDWDRALTQLEVAAQLDAGASMMAQTYREAVRCEAIRADVFAGHRTPLIFGEPGQWVAFLLEALRLGQAGRPDEAAEMRRQALKAAPTIAGTINGDPFEWVADADLRMGPVMEAVVNGRYYWVPFSCIATLEIEAPADLRDLVWTPVQFRWTNGGDAVGLVPTRYPGSEASSDSRIRLARLTDWSEQPGEQFFGLGQRVFATDRDEYPLLEVRDIRLGPDAEGDAAAPAAAD